MTLLVVGSVNADLTVRAPHIPTPGETVLGGDVRVSPGGKGANQAVAAALAVLGGARNVVLGLGALPFVCDLRRGGRFAMHRLGAGRLGGRLGNRRGPQHALVGFVSAEKRCGRFGSAVRADTVFVAAG